MLKIRISKRELKNLYQGREGATNGDYSICPGDEEIPNGDLTLLRAMLEIFKDKAGEILFPDFLLFWRETRRLTRRTA